MAKRKKGRDNAPVSAPDGPSAQTLFRYRNLDLEARDVQRKLAARLSPVYALRDAPRVRLIRAAETAEDLVVLAPAISGLVEPMWQDRLQAFGPEIVPLVAERLPAVGEMDEDIRPILYECLLGALRWWGSAGADAILANFAKLDPYGQSLACIVLGLLKHGADTIGDFFERAFETPDNNFIGGVWGLIDGSPAAGVDSLVKLVIVRRYFYELFPLLAGLGDERTFVPTLMWAADLSEDRKTDAFVALIGQAHRLGRARLLQVLTEGDPDEDAVQDWAGIVDQILAQPASVGEQVFAEIVRGPGLDDLERLVQQASSLGEK